MLMRMHFYDHVELTSLRHFAQDICLSREVNRKAPQKVGLSCLPEASNTN